MHEGAVMQAVVTAMLDSLKTLRRCRVTLVHLEIGTSGHFTEEAVRQYFQLFTQDTAAAGARLELFWLPATYQCLSCAHRFESAISPGICPHCGDVGLEIAHQDSCAIRRIEVVADDVYSK